MKLKRKKKQKAPSKPMIYFKAFFLISLFSAALLISFILSKNNKNKPKKHQSVIQTEYPTQAPVKKPIEKVLGEQSAKLKDNIPKSINSLSQSINKSIDQTKDKAVNTLDQFIYQTTIKPMIEKINQLPQSQQEYVKKEICQ